MKKKLFSVLLLLIFTLTNFTTVMAASEPIYTEDFNDAPDSALWTKTKGYYDGEHSRTGLSSYMVSNGTKLAFTVGETYNNKVYEVWMYYKKDSSENKQIILKGANTSGKTLYIYAFTNKTKIQIKGSSTVTGNYTMSTGWHKFVVDCTDATATKLYINGSPIYTFSAADSLSSVTTVSLES